MSSRASNCPQCGAKIEFRWSGAVQTVCEFCQSVLIRGDIDLTRVGTVADLPPDASPIQINTEGVWENKAFTVVGRIVYAHDQGSWNEWHLLFQDGASGWLSDAQLEWSISFQSAKGGPIPAEEQLLVGSIFTVENVAYTVTVRTRAAYSGVDGQLPFAYWDKDSPITFVDFRTQDNRFATIDFSEAPPILFTGQFVEFEALGLKNLRQFEGWL